MSNPATPKGQPLPAHVEEAIVEIVYAGAALANYLTFQIGSHFECICGVATVTPKRSDTHKASCPVARFYAAIDAAMKAVRS